MFWLVAKLM